MECIFYWKTKDRYNFLSNKNNNNKKNNIYFREKKMLLNIDG